MSAAYRMSVDAVISLLFAHLFADDVDKLIS